MSSASGCNRFDRKDEEFEQKDKKLEHLRREHKERRERSDSVDNPHGTGSHQSGSHQHWDRSREYEDRDSISPEERRPRNATMDAMSCALRRVARSPFSMEIGGAPMPSRFTRPSFNS